MGAATPERSTGLLMVAVVFISETQTQSGSAEMTEVSAIVLLETAAL